MPKTFYIADTHFQHANILRFDQRTFNDLEEMHEVLIDNWNRVVSNEDWVYILGDFCWGKEPDRKELLKKLSGHKVLIRGNHDLKEMSSPLRNMFQDVRDYKEIKDNGRRVILCHYPILFYRSAYNPNVYHLCGHVHTTRENDFLEKWRQELWSTKKNNGDSCGNIYNVGCMMPYMGYTPRTLDEILASHGELSTEDAKNAERTENRLEQ